MKVGVQLGMLSDDSAALPELNITPLIDIVFILLIFFVVTTTFVHELGLPIERPESHTAREPTPDIVRVAVGHHGELAVDGSETSVWRLEPEVRTRLRGHGGTAVLVVADRETSAQTLVKVIDACRQAGARDVALGVEEGPAS